MSENVQKNFIINSKFIHLSTNLCYNPEFDTCESKKWLQTQ